MTNFKTAIAVAVGSLFAGAAFAQSNFSIEQRDRAEDARIERGIESGQLTRNEAYRLEGERAQIERLERRARADGVVTQQERAQITRAQDRLGRDIYRETHDRQVANNGWRTSDRPHGWDRRDANDNRRDMRFNGFSDHYAARVSHNDSRVDDRTTHTATDTNTGTNTRFGRSDLAPGRQPHVQQTDSQSTQVQQAQTQRTWTRPAQASGTATTTATGTSTSASPDRVARQGGYSRTSTSSSPVVLARQGGYGGRHIR
jgi:hypothetical protein